MSFLKKNPAMFLGLGISLLFLLLAMVRIDILDALEFKQYDILMGFRGNPTENQDIVLIDIDNDSIEKLGRWPWPRSLIAEGIDKLSAASPKAIGLNIIYSEPDESSTLKELEYLEKSISEEAGSKKSPILKAIRKTLKRLDNDGKLATSLANAGNIILPVFFKASLNGVLAKKDMRLSKESVPKTGDSQEWSLPAAGGITMPVERFFKTASGIGHVNMSYDSDGRVRRESMMYDCGGMQIPSFSLRLAAFFMDLKPDEINTDPGRSITLGSIQIPVNRSSEFLINFKGPAGSFKSFPIYDVIKDKIPSLNSLLKDRIVIITPSASGVMGPVPTPVAKVMPIGEVTANTIWAILNQKYVSQPSWNNLAGYGLILFTGIIISFVLPRLKAVFAAICFISLLCLLTAGSGYMFVSKGLWIQTAYPIIQLIIGYIGIVSIGFLVTETKKEKVEGESAETNRMLGISFQSQGMLDMAFDKLRKVPVDDEMKDVLYNLALDYERKRQFNKAASVYEYIEGYDPKYKSVGLKKKKLLQASETMVFGDGFLGGGSSSDDMLSSGSNIRPTLGRYEIVRQLGKGAMGVVYLGKDPRINRTTAIKTFKFEDDLDQEEMKKLKEKFFREAESAGTLSHPNIVTIYDAGDEHDLAYIAMEYLEGEDLMKYTKKPNLLPARQVLDIIADIAEGLDYAHKQGVVHRDIKPANIMKLKSGIIKITDFGIARITASSQTQTGVVKGTPHYMSPEQISGEKVDGRSDIFSLGSMMFQMLTGSVPFKGDSPAALMHQIINVQHPNPKTINPKLLNPHVTIIDKAIEKNRNKRYQQASQMANHLRMLGKKIDEITKKKKA